VFSGGKSVPTYAYACKDCGHAFDIQQSFTDSTLTVCPECEGALRKKFNSVGVVFKGSGFYRTDSRDSKGSTVSSGTKDSASSGKDASAGKESSAASKPAPATAGASASSSASGSGSTSSKAAAAS
jgi:putative FmdB family regulatory protein